MTWNHGKDAAEATRLAAEAHIRGQRAIGQPKRGNQSVDRPGDDGAVIEVLEIARWDLARLALSGLAQDLPQLPDLWNRAHCRAVRTSPAHDKDR